MNQSSVNLTNHGRERLNERLKIKSEKKGLRMATLAFERGKVIYLEANGNRHLLFNNNVFIFSSEAVLITVYRKKNHHPWKNRDYSYEKSYQGSLRCHRWDEEMN